MPRARKSTAALPDEEDLLVLPDEVPDDPRPRAARAVGRPRKAAAPRAAGNRGRIPARTSAGRVMSETQMIAKVRDEVGMWLEILAGGAEAVDPECTNAALAPTRNGQPRLDAIADRLTSMIARNKSLLVMAAKTGIIGDVVALIGLSVPIGRAVWRAHGPGGHGHTDTGVSGDFDQYAPWAGAAAS